MIKNARGVLFEVVLPKAGLEAIINNVKEGELYHHGGRKEKFRQTIIPQDKNFGWWVFEQTLHDKRGKVLAHQRALIPTLLNEEAFLNLLREIGREIKKKVKIVDVRDRDSHKPPGKEYAHWYLITTEEVKHPYRESRVLERVLVRQ